MSEFCQTYNLYNLITEPTCYKNPNNPSSIDMILTNPNNPSSIDMILTNPNNPSSIDMILTNPNNPSSIDMILTVPNNPSSIDMIITNPNNPSSIDMILTVPNNPSSIDMIITNPNNPSSIDTILTNRKNSFENSATIETGLSDLHKIIFTMLNSKFKKKDPKVINFRCYKNFHENSFREDLRNALQNTHAEMIYENFKQISMTILNLHAPVIKNSSEETMHPL